MRFLKKKVKFDHGPAKSFGCGLMLIRPVPEGGK